MCSYDFNCSTTHKEEFPNKIGMHVRVSNIMAEDDWQLKSMCEVNNELSRFSLKKCEIEIQEIIHLHNVANQLTDECTDPMK